MLYFIFLSKKDKMNVWYRYRPLRCKMMEIIIIIILFEFVDRWLLHGALNGRAWEFTAMSRHNGVWWGDDVKSFA